jgi:8-oxo-dGTP diphosphatase
MPHIHTESGQHDQTATAYIIGDFDSVPKALVHMHRKLHILLPVGGHVELNENPWQAVVHEIGEESGYTLEELTILQPISRLKSMPDIIVHPYPVVLNTHQIAGLDHYHTDTIYSFVAHSLPKHTMEEGESLDLRWLSHTELTALDPTLLYPSTLKIYDFIFDTVLTDWEEVPTSEFEL